MTILQFTNSNETPHLTIQNSVPMLNGRPFISHNLFYKFVNATNNENKRLFVLVWVDLRLFNQRPVRGWLSIELESWVNWNSESDMVIKMQVMLENSIWNRFIGNAFFKVVLVHIVFEAQTGAKVWMLSISETCLEQDLWFFYIGN